MTTDLAVMLADVPTFGGCSGCARAQVGPVDSCFRCALAGIEIAGRDHSCSICELPFNPGEVTCRNPPCGSLFTKRWFVRNYAVGMRSGPLETAITRFKYQEQRGWAAIFARILLGFLEANRWIFGDVHMITASPAFVGEGAHRSWDHLRLVLEAADREQAPASSWPFDLGAPPAIVKTGETPRMVGMSYQERKANARGPLREALRVPDAARTWGRSIIVVDDVFTDGLTLNEVARALICQGNADRVVGLTLARQPFRSRPSTGSGGT